MHARDHDEDRLVAQESGSPDVWDNTDPLSLDEIADMLNIAPAQVRQIEALVDDTLSSEHHRSA